MQPRHQASEDPCHAGVVTEKPWRPLRLALAAHGVAPHKPPVVRICTPLEAGARLQYGKSDEAEECTTEARGL